MTPVADEVTSATEHLCTLCGRSIHAGQRVWRWREGDRRAHLACVLEVYRL